MTNPILSQNALNLLQNLDQNTSTNPNGMADYNKLLGYIQSDPTLINQLNTDVGNTWVKSFNWSAQAGSGAFFNGSDDSININVSTFTAIPPEYLPYTETFVLAHELGHSEFAEGNAFGLPTPFQAANTLQGLVGDGTSDLTSGIQAYEGDYNYNESNSQLLGFNAVLSEYYGSNNITDPTAAQIQSAYKAAWNSGYGQYFLTNVSRNTYSLQPGLATDNSGTGALAVSLANMAAEGNYYNQMGSGSVSSTG